MSDKSLDDLARRLEQLPREAWDRPDPPPPPWPAEERPARRRGLLLRPAAAVAASVVLLVAGLAAGLLLGGGDDDPAAPDGVQVALGPVEGRGEGASGEASLEREAGGRADVRVTGLRPSGSGDFYELWLIGDAGELVSLGSFRVPQSGTAELNVPLPVDPERFSFVDVSREPDDGDPSHSKVSVLRGPT